MGRFRDSLDSDTTSSADLGSTPGSPGPNVQPGQFGAPGPAAPSAPRGGVGTILQFLIAGVGALVIPGAFLPWATASTKIGGSSISSSASGIAASAST